MSVEGEFLYDWVYSPMYVLFYYVYSFMDEVVRRNVFFPIVLEFIRKIST